MRRFTRPTAAFLWALGTIAVQLSIAVNAEAHDSRFVRVDGGAISGTEINGSDAYLGIPYAAPPVGNLRWRPPKQAASWRGVLPARKFGNTCPQNADLGVFATPSDTEDCLYLNVFVSKKAQRSHKKLPVMFWIYGGGHTVGESDDYDGSKLANDGETIVVTINYRLGILGFFAHPTIDKEDHLFADYGVMDQQFALRWVKRNIEAFGGDPDNITIFGESAGGRSVIFHLISPQSKGLFQQAIIESGAGVVSKYPASSAARPLDVAEQTGTAFANAAGCTDQSAECLRKLSVKQILAIQTPYNIGNGIIDGKLLPEPVGQAIEAGRYNHVPVMNGSNRDEWRWSAANT